MRFADKALCLALVGLLLCPLAVSSAYALDEQMQALPVHENHGCLNCHDGPASSLSSAGTDPTQFNDFGDDWIANGSVWSQALAMLDSDGDGCSNGHELGNPAGTWTAGQTRPAAQNGNPGVQDCENAAVLDESSWGILKAVFGDIESKRN